MLAWGVMRIWEVEDNKALSADLVREQDFIMCIRRLHRLGTAHLVANIVLSAFDAQHQGRGPIEGAQQRLQDYVRPKNGSYHEMANGDVFVVWPDTASAKGFSQEAMRIALPQGTMLDDMAKGLLLYHLPADYAALRERANHYVEIAHNVVATPENSSPAQLLQSDAARGPLSAWSVNQIELLLKDIDLHRYVRTQPVYARLSDGHWKPLFEEQFIGFDALRAAHFPHLELGGPEHLFLELCQALDRRLLADLTEKYDTIAGRTLSLNLSVASVMGSVFAQFTHRVPRAERGKITFELHRGDLLQDFALTLNAMMTLHREGFRVAIDSVTPDMLSYLNLALFEADFIKLNVAKDRAGQLTVAATLAALSRIPREKLIFFHCDSEPALQAGIALGVTRYQGWLIDEHVRGNGAPPTPHPHIQRI